LKAHSSRKLVLLLAVVAAVTVTLGVPGATGSSYQRSYLFQDCSTGCPEAIDMVGPSGFGWINYTTYGPDLKLQVQLRNAEPNASYRIFLTCGPTHATACGFVDVGGITTDRYGRGNANQIIVPTQFGGGARTDHVDILAASGPATAGAYVAADINYTVP
jgi:hypothetical protein